MDNLLITINLSGKTQELGIIHSIEKALGIPLSILPSWDAFFDNLRSLDTEAEIIKQKKPKKIHLILQNIEEFEYESRKHNNSDFDTFRKVLARATDKKQRYDGIDFTFEIENY